MFSGHYNTLFAFRFRVIYVIMFSRYELQVIINNDKRIDIGHFWYKVLEQFFKNELKDIFIPSWFQIKSLHCGLGLVLLHPNRIIQFNNFSKDNLYSQYIFRNPNVTRKMHKNIRESLGNGYKSGFFAILSDSPWDSVS